MEDEEGIDFNQKYQDYEKIPLSPHEVIDKFKGKKKKWWREQTLFWQGRSIKRDSEEFQLLLTKAFDALFENDGFRNALKATNNSTLTHSIGKNDIHRTVLTEREFIHQLNRLRDKLN
jgi:hypothetical protein